MLCGLFFNVSDREIVLQIQVCLFVFCFFLFSPLYLNVLSTVKRGMLKSLSHGFTYFSYNISFLPENSTSFPNLWANEFSHYYSSFSCISTTYSKFNLSPGQKQSFNSHSLVTLLWWSKDERADKAKEGLETQEQKNQTLIILPCPML